MTARATRPKKTPTARTASASSQQKADRSAPLDPLSMEEPRLRDMLLDPIMQRLMSSDGITQNQLMVLVAAARSRLREETYLG